MPNRILVAMSGGVDSAVAALLLKQQGFEVSAAYMKTWVNEAVADAMTDCPWHQDIIDAENCAKIIGIKFEIVNLISEYRKKVVEYIVDGYRNGSTPNPDVICNKHIKFGDFINYALKCGFDTVATGHYCSVRDNPDGSRDLVVAADPSKNQSYFLAMITQPQLRRIIFPIGSLLKSEVRDIARINNLPVSEKKDSQGICFLGKVKIQDFLKQFIPQEPGDIVNESTGKKLGTHTGLYNYTIGQRKGIRIPSNTEGKHYVVTNKDISTNTLYVDFDSQNAENLYRNSVTVRNLNWINKPVDCQHTIQIQVRYRDPMVKAVFTPLGNGRAKIEFEKRQRALSPGQVIAMYNEDIMLGGAFYE